MNNDSVNTADSDEYVAPLPMFGHGEFRCAAARYVKRLIRARWKSDPNFLSQEDLQRWKLDNIADDSEKGWQLLHLAARDLGQLNCDFLPRCGSGGVEPVGEETPVARLIFNLSFLASWNGGGPNHNQDLVDAAVALKAGKSIDWEELVDWGKLPQIRDDLDQLPEPRISRDERPGESFTAIDRIGQILEGQQLKLFNYLCGSGDRRVSYNTIRQDEKLHDAFRVDSPDDETIQKALKRLKKKLVENPDDLRYVDMTVGTDYVSLTISDGQI